MSGGIFGGNNKENIKKNIEVTQRIRSAVNEIVKITADALSLAHKNELSHSDPSTTNNKPNIAKNR